MKKYFIITAPKLKLYFSWVAENPIKIKIGTNAGYSCQLFKKLPSISAKKLR